MLDNPWGQRIAEYLLALVMPDERGQATVGDLVELRCGQVKFWFTIAKTLAAYVWNGLLSDGAGFAVQAAVSWCILTGLLVAPLMLAPHRMHASYPEGPADMGVFQIWPYYWQGKSFLSWWGWMVPAQRICDWRRSGWSSAALITVLSWATLTVTPVKIGSLTISAGAGRVLMNLYMLHFWGSPDVIHSRRGLLPDRLDTRLVRWIVCASVFALLSLLVGIPLDRFDLYAALMAPGVSGFWFILIRKFGNHPAFDSPPQDGSRQLSEPH